jgi:glycosyltransferase involved in cell wall biosynthesis
MVKSARQSLSGCYGIQYEFVIVDGGSSDGTQKWCNSQSDIRLIEHLSLLGAVKAFNDGANAALGTYVVLV